MIFLFIIPCIHRTFSQPIRILLLSTSNMSNLWLHSWIHSFQALADQTIEWYAVVTYEALISYHDQVVEELLEVVRSGVGRYQNRDGRNSLVMAGTAATKDDEEENAERRRSTSSRNGDNNTSRTRSTTTTNHHRRRLEMHGNKNTTQSSSANSYLVPKERSMKLWKQCLDRTICAQLLSRLTKDIFPDLGYVNEDGRPPLRKTPGTVTVSKEYGRVLFTSEGMALNKLRQELTSSSSSSTRDGTLNDEAAETQQQLIDYVPTFEFISKMKRALK
jgi:hypothetical protein